MTSPALPLLNLRRPEIATVLNIDISVVDDLIQSGELPSFKLGGTRLARFEDVREFNDTRARQSITDGSKDVDDKTRGPNAPHANQTTPASSTTPASTNENVIPMREPKKRRGRPPRPVA